MRVILSAALLSTCLVGSSAFAADEDLYNDNNSDQAPGQVYDQGSDQAMTSTNNATDITSGYIRNEVVGIKPQVGALVFRDQYAAQTARVIEGLTLDGNISKMINKDWNNVFIGPSVGVLFSHLGDPTSNFAGTNADPNSSVGAYGANLLIIPADVKLGYNLSDNLRLAAHGGGNVIYRSIASSMNLGDTSGGTAPVWSIFPNVGADAEFGLGRHVALMLRPDWTVTPGDTLFSGTVALNIPLT